MVRRIVDDDEEDGGDTPRGQAGEGEGTAEITAPLEAENGDGDGDEANLQSKRADTGPKLGTAVENNVVFPPFKLPQSQIETISKLVGQFTDVNDAITNAMSSVGDAAVDMEELYDDRRVASQKVKTLEGAFCELIDLQERMLATKGAVLHLTQTSSRSNNPIQLIATFDKEVKSRCEVRANMSKADKYGNHEEFRELKRRIWDIHNEGRTLPPASRWFAINDDIEDGDAMQNGNEDVGDDIVMEHEKQSLKCPITLTTFEEPVRNTHCPHIFSKAAILDMIRQGRLDVIECPVPGCNADIHSSNLIADKVMQRRVQRFKARLSGVHSTVAEEIDDDDDDDDNAAQASTLGRRRRGNSTWADIKVE